MEPQTSYDAGTDTGPDRFSPRRHNGQNRISSPSNAHEQNPLTPQFRSPPLFPYLKSDNHVQSFHPNERVRIDQNEPVVVLDSISVKGW